MIEGFSCDSVAGVRVYRFRGAAFQGLRGIGGLTGFRCFVPAFRAFGG